MSREAEASPALCGVLAAMATFSREQLSASLSDPDKVQTLCGMVEDVGPNTELDAAVLVLAGLLRAERRLDVLFSKMIEDAEVFGVHSPPTGASVYEARCIRGLLVGLVAAHDPEAAERVAAEREVPWPDEHLWPKGPPRTVGEAFARIGSDLDEKKVGVLGLHWIEAEVLPQGLASRMKPVLELLVEVGDAVREATEEELKELEESRGGERRQGRT